MTSSVRHGAAGHNQDEGAEWCAIRLGDDEVNAVKPVGAKLARESVVSANIIVGCAAVFASKLCSYRD
jgi:hypothetical protein